jgi:hypothetical protein
MKFELWMLLVPVGLGILIYVGWRIKKWRDADKLASIFFPLTKKEKERANDFWNKNPELEKALEDAMKEEDE